MAKNNNITTQQVYDLVDKKYGELNASLKSLETKVDSHFVTHAEFEPIKKLVYGMVGLILIAVMGALVALVVKQ